MPRRKPNSESAQQSRDPGPEALRSLLAQKMTQEDMATRLGISSRTLYSYFRKHGIDPARYVRVRKGLTRQDIRNAVKGTNTAKEAAAKLGMTEATLHELCDRYQIKRTWSVASPLFRKIMSASTAQSKAGRAGVTRSVGTDMMKLIEDAVAAIAAAGGQVPRCPTAFAAVSEHAKPLSKEDSEALKAHQEKLDAA